MLKYYHKYFLVTQAQKTADISPPRFTVFYILLSFQSFRLPPLSRLLGAALGFLPGPLRSPRPFSGSMSSGLPGPAGAILNRSSLPSRNSGPLELPGAAAVALIDLRSRQSFQGFLRSASQGVILSMIFFTLFPDLLPPIRSAFHARPPRIRTGSRRFPSSWGLHWARCRGLGRSPKASRLTGAVPPPFLRVLALCGLPARPPGPFCHLTGRFLYIFISPLPPTLQKRAQRWIRPPSPQAEIDSLRARRGGASSTRPHFPSLVHGLSFFRMFCIVA